MGTRSLHNIQHTMVISCKALLTPHAMFNMVELVLAIVSFLLARVGYAGHTPSFGSSLDQVWLGFLTVGGWLVILPAILLWLVLVSILHLAPVLSTTTPASSAPRSGTQGWPW